MARAPSKPRAPRKLLDLYAPAEVRRRFAERGVPLGDKLPSFIKPYAAYMRERAGKRPSTRDVLKAYIITRASVQRTARAKATVCKAFPEYANPGVKDFVARESVRPEDLMALMLQLPTGQKFLNAAERGSYDREAATRLLEAMRCFGLIFPKYDEEGNVVKSNRGFLAKDLLRATATVRELAPEIARLTSPDVPAETAYKFFRKNVFGINAAKTGFLLSLLGRGDIPTFDARELTIWRRPGEARGPEWPDVANLSERFDDLDIRIAPEDRRNRKHLIHHMLWDGWGEAKKDKKTGRTVARSTETTHEELIRAMRLAGPRYRLVSRR